MHLGHELVSYKSQSSSLLIDWAEDMRDDAKKGGNGDATRFYEGRLDNVKPDHKASTDEAWACWSRGGRAYRFSGK